jgi:hypothetical protein
MMRYSITLLALAACASSEKTMPPVLTRADQLDSYVNQVVTLRGVVSNTKMPQILGVDVTSDNPDLRGQEAEATGTLIKWKVTQEELDADIKKYGMIPNRGTGTFYRLKSPTSAENAQVRPVAKR